MWQSAQDRPPDPWESRWHCRTCPIGAQHAAASPTDFVARIHTAEAVKRFEATCPRCVRLTTRMIRSREGRKCPSCYNRAREVRAGRNRKGGFPRLTNRLHPETLAVASAGGTPAQLRTFDSVVSRLEAMMLAAYEAAGPSVFGRAPLTVHIRAPE